MVAPLAADPTIIVHAGGVRVGNTTTVAGLPAGAVFTATEVGGTGATFTCTTSGTTGTCSIGVTPAGHEWDVTETTPPPGYYLNPTIDSGTSSSVSSFPYTFRTAVLNGTTTVDVPGATPNGPFTSQPIPPDANGQVFSGLLSTSLNNPAVVSECGLNIALVLDQSGSMAQNGKQAALVSAANEAVTDLTGTPSNVAIYTFGPTTGPSIAKTSTINANTAAPLHTFINNLPAPAGGTNWDQGLAQVASGFDDVIFVTDGAPTGSRVRTNNFAVSEFTDTDQGIFSANGIKASGTTRVLGVGIGIGTGTPPSGGADNLRAVSGSTQGQDYFLGTNNDFGAILRALATGACNNQLTITKQIENSSGVLISPTPADANGWTFANTISGDVGDTIVSPVTTAAINGANGVAQAALTIRDLTPTLTVTETPQAGYTFVSAQCTVGGSNVPTNVSGTEATFTGAPGQPLGCTFTNRRSRTTTTATVITNAAGGAPVTGPLPLHSSVIDTSTVTPSPAGGPTPTGSVTYTFFHTIGCTDTGTAAGGGALVGGLPPNSSPEGPLVAGSYGFEATYSGDTNYAGSTSTCEPLTISTGTSATATVITNAAGGAPVTGPLPLHSSVIDTSTVTPTPTGFTPTGSVTYTFFHTIGCTDTGTAAGGGALVGGLPPNSSPEGPLVAGSYGFEATYSGDTNYAGSTSTCEPLTISTGTSATATVITNAAGGAPVTGPLPLHSSVIDTSTVTPTPTGFTPTGSVTYTFFHTIGCTDTGTAAGGGALVGGLPPNSSPEGPLVAGSYGFEATYSGDANYAGSTSTCEPLTISTGTSATATVITNAAGGAPVTGPLPLHSSVIDTSTVTPTPTGFTPTGSVTYTFFHTIGCTDTGTAAGGGALVGGLPPNSSPEGPLVAGSYGFEATYSGDANYAGSTSTCEPLTISTGTSATATVITNAAGGAPVTGPLPAGSSVFDTSTVTPTPAGTGFTPTGTVTYTFFTDATTCSGPDSTFTVTLNTNGSVPPSSPHGPLAAGSYSFQAVYSGDANFTGSTSTCEPLTITQAAPTIATTPSAGGQVGISVSDTATLSGGFNPTGTVTFDLFGPGDATCGGDAVFTSTNTLSARSATSDTFPTTVAGTYEWMATYNGDVNNAAVTSLCGDESVVLAQATPTIATTPSAGGRSASPSRTRRR